MDWLDLLAIQGTLKSLLQHHSSKASILWCSAFFILQLSHWTSHPVMLEAKKEEAPDGAIMFKMEIIGDLIKNRFTEMMGYSHH